MVSLTKADFIKSTNRIAIEAGFTVDDLNILKTPGYYTALTGEIFDSVLQYASIVRREAYESTAQLEDSLLKIGAGIQLQASMASPASARFIVFFNQKDLLKMCEIDENGKYNFTIRKDTTYITIDDLIFSLDYDIKIEIFDNPNAYFKNVEPYVYRANYISDYHNPLDVGDKNYNMPLNIAKYESELIDNALVGLIVDMKQYKRVYKTLRYITDNEAEIKVFEYNDKICGFNVKYKETDSGTERAINKSQYFNGANVSEEVIFFKMGSNNTIELINKRIGNFIPVVNSIITVEMYETKGEKGNINYTGENGITYTSDESSIRSSVRILEQSTGGKDPKTLEDIRSEIELAKYTRGSVINEKDLKKHYDMSTGRYKVYKTRHDMYAREYNVYMALKDTEKNVFIETNTLPVRINTAAMTPYDGVDGDGLDIPGNYFMIGESGILAYDAKLAYGYPLTTDDVVQYEYTTPFNLVYNKEKNYVEVYERYVDRVYNMKNKFTNSNLDAHFIVNKISMNKPIFGQHSLTFNLITSLGSADNPILHTNTDKSGIIDNGIIKVRLLMKNSGITEGFVDCNMIAYDKVNDLYKYHIPEGFLENLTYNNNTKLHCKDFVTKEDTVIEIPIGNNEFYLYVYYKAKSETYVDDFFTDMVGYQLATVYGATEIDFFKNISHLNNLQCNYISRTGSDLVVDVLNVPLVSRRMMENTPDYVFSLLNYELDKIENVYMKTEENYDLNINFANTYGFSKKYMLGIGGIRDLWSIALKFQFVIKVPSSSLLSESDCMEVIKKYVSTVDFNNGSLLHVSKIIDALHQAFPEIQFVEFKGINDLPTSYQCIVLTATDVDNTVSVPEILNVEHVYSEYLRTYVPNIEVTIMN